MRDARWLMLCLVSYFLLSTSSLHADNVSVIDHQLKDSKPLPVKVISGVGVGAATAALQTTGNNSLASLDTKLSSQATATKQDSGNTSVASIDANQGAKADTVASSDTGTFSLIALVKRALQTLTTIATNTTSIATSSLQTTGNTSLGTIVTNTTNNATTTKQSDGTQKTQVVNAAGTEVNTGTLVSSTAYESSHVLKASSGALISIAGYNSKTGAQFIQLFNSATVPADATAPVLVFTVPASSNFSYDVPITGLPFSTGIAIANSSTGPTKTIGSADCYFTAVTR